MSRGDSASVHVRSFAHRIIAKGINGRLPQGVGGMMWWALVSTLKILTLFSFIWVTSVLWHPSENKLSYRKYLCSAHVKLKEEWIVFWSKGHDGRHVFVFRVWVLMKSSGQRYQRISYGMEYTLILCKQLVTPSYIKYKRKVHREFVALLT